jgi:hypothetical protein
MEYIREILFKETIRFLGFCQKLKLDGKISDENYYSMTKIKFDFLDNIIRLGEREFFIDKDTRLSLNEIYRVDYFISNTNSNAVGN